MEQVNKTQEELDLHFKRCYTEFPYYAKHNLKISTKEFGLQPFILNEVQVILEEIVTDIESQGRLVRLYILKARQEGVSTGSTGRYFWKTSNNKNKNAVIVTHEPPATQELFDMQKRYYKHLQPEFKPETKYNNTRRLQFDNEDSTGLDSSIKVATAGVKDFGSGQVIHYLHISELSKWPRENEDSLLTSLFQCVPSAPGTSIVIESTAKGIGGEFHKGYWASRYQYEVYLEDGEAKWKLNINKDADPDNIFASVFIPWFVFKKYRKELPEGFEKTPEEEIMAKRHNLDDNQIQWYRYILANECRGDKAIRDQEYPCTARSAFIGSGTSAFNVEQVLDLKSKCKPPSAICMYNHAKRTIIEEPEGDIKIWERPRPGVPYLISADVAEGLEDGDFDSAKVWNHMTMKEVANYHGHLSPFRFAYLLYHLGQMYNYGWLVPERNNHGISVVEKLLELEYPNIYMEMVDDPPHKPRRRFGWVTSNKSRVLIIDNLIDDVINGICGIADSNTYDEMLNFKRQKDGKIEADPGTFDDRVMDAAIGRYALKTLSYVSIYSNSIYEQQGSGTTIGIHGGLIQRKPPASAWN